MTRRFFKVAEEGEVIEAIFSFKSMPRGFVIYFRPHDRVIAKFSMRGWKPRFMVGWKKRERSFSWPYEAEWITFPR